MILKVLWNYMFDFVSKWLVKTSNDSKSPKFNGHQSLMVTKI